MSPRSSVASGNNRKLEALLEDLKRLAILQLITSGVQATQIAKALGVNKSVVSRLVPARGIKK
jgi:hypothetical protein